MLKKSTSRVSVSPATAAAGRAILLVLVGHRGASDDEELGAHQPDAFRAAAGGGVGVFRDVDVRPERDAYAVRRDRLERSELGERRFGDGFLALALVVRV